jgi:3-methylfumaryl-CoA hydratase
VNWQAQERVVSDSINLQSAQFLALTLDRPEVFALGDVLPNAWHWVYFLEAASRSTLGYDGHAAKGEFLPPIDLPRRMWAGSRFQFTAPLRFGETIARRSVIERVEEKTGRTGRLAFVTVVHTFSGEDGQMRFVEAHDIVYREAEPHPDPHRPLITVPAPSDPTVSQIITPDPTLLFRYSALTFNGHRIHYDLPFCQEFEGYRHLVVHGPLIATLLINLASDHGQGRAMTAFSFKAKSPLFCDAPFSIHGKSDADAMQLWASNAEGGLAMEARASYS